MAYPAAGCSSPGCVKFYSVQNSRPWEIFLCGVPFRPRASWLFGLAAGGNGAGTGMGDIFRTALFDELEILYESRRQRPVLAVVALAVRPGAGRVENPRRNAFEFDRKIETEDGVGAVGHGFQLAGEGGIEQGARVANGDSLADTERAAGPSGIDQPAGDIVLQQARLEHFPVGIRMAHHEGTAEAGAETNFRFRAQADLGAADLADVVGKEVVDGLFGSEAGDGRNDAVGVAGEKNDVARMAGHLRRQIVFDVIERIGAASILGEGVVVEVEAPGERIEHDVLQDGAEAAGAGVDLRFGLGREADDLGIAAILEVEDAAFAPAVLVVADQAARGVGRKRRLAGAGEAEEQRHVSIGTDVGGAVHGQDVFPRKQEIEDGEDGLLDFAAVAGAADDGQALREVDDDEGLRARAVNHGRRQEGRRADHGELRHVPLEGLGAANLHEHVAREETVPGLFRDDPDGHAVVRVGGGVAILHEHVAALQETRDSREERAELLGAEGAVILSPPDVVFSGLLADDELVGRGARGMFAGGHDDRAEMGNASLSPENNLLVQRRSGEIPVDAVQVGQPVVCQAINAGQLAGFGQRRRRKIEIWVHRQSLTSLRSPRKSSLGAPGSSAHLMRSIPSVISFMVPQKLRRRWPSMPNSRPGTVTTRTLSSSRRHSFWESFS